MDYNKSTLEQETIYVLFPILLFLVNAFQKRTFHIFSKLPIFFFYVISFTSQILSESKHVIKQQLTEICKKDKQFNGEKKDI